MTIACYYLGLAWLPILLALIMSCTLFITYNTSVYLGHVNAEFPFVSSTGAYPPDSCLFAEGLNLSAFLSVICSFIWYRLALKDTEYLSKQPKCLLVAMLWISVLAGLGLTLVGNFQQVNVEIVHDIGAGLAFGGTTIYMAMCTHINRVYLKKVKRIWILRLLLTIAACISGLLFFICHIIARIDYSGTPESALTFRHPSEGGYYPYLCSTISEWILGVVIISFFLTWALEFKEYALQLPEPVESAAIKESTMDY